RARSNPTAEAQRLGIGVNDGLPAGTITGPAMPLAPNQLLLNAATAHSQDMLQNNYFNFNSPSGSTPLSRILAAGYPAAQYAGALARGTTAVTDATADVQVLYNSLFLTPGDRNTLLGPQLAEVGPGLAVVATSSGLESVDATVDFGTQAGAFN